MNSCLWKSAKPCPCNRFSEAWPLPRRLADADIDGITEICPANASCQIRFNPDIIAPDDLLALLQGYERELAGTAMHMDTRLIEIPLLYNDPWTKETGARFRERHQNPNATDLEYAARINGYAGIDDFIAAHSGSPWFVSMVGFVAGLPFMFQMVERERQIEVPKYLLRAPTLPNSPSATAAALPAFIRCAAPAATRCSASRRHRFSIPNSAKAT